MRRSEAKKFVVRQRHLEAYRLAKWCCERGDEQRWRDFLVENMTEGKLGEAYRLGALVADQALHDAVHSTRLSEETRLTWMTSAQLSAGCRLMDEIFPHLSSAARCRNCPCDVWPTTRCHALMLSRRGFRRLLRAEAQRLGLDPRLYRMR